MVALLIPLQLPFGPFVIGALHDRGRITAISQKSHNLAVDFYDKRHILVHRIADQEHKRWESLFASRKSFRFHPFMSTQRNVSPWGIDVQQQTPLEGIFVLLS